MKDMQERLSKSEKDMEETKKKRIGNDEKK